MRQSVPFFVLLVLVSALFCAGHLRADEPAKVDALSAPTPGELAEEARMAAAAGGKKHMNDAFYIKVGETKPIYAQRSDSCVDNSIPPFSGMEKRLPKTDLIAYKDGGATKRFSRRCQKVVPALMVLATGVKAGKATITFDGEALNLVVE